MTGCVLRRGSDRIVPGYGAGDVIERRQHVRRASRRWRARLARVAWRRRGGESGAKLNREAMGQCRCQEERCRLCQARAGSFRSCKRRWCWRRDHNCLAPLDTPLRRGQVGDGVVGIAQRVGCAVERILLFRCCSRQTGDSPGISCVPLVVIWSTSFLPSSTLRASIASMGTSDRSEWRPSRRQPAEMPCAADR